MYCYEPIMCSYFMRSRVAGSRTVEECAVKLTSPEDRTLIFEARFESGNLQRAVQVSKSVVNEETIGAIGACFEQTVSVSSQYCLLAQLGKLQFVFFSKQVGEYDYELTLRTDLYTPKHTQW